jgi:hypothetical protein
MMKLKETIMNNNPPPYSDITGISRAVMKDNAQVTIANYNGNARPGELVVEQITNTLYVGDTNGNLTILVNGADTENTWNPLFTDASGTFAGGTVIGNYILIGALCYFHFYIDFTGVTNYGTGQYQFNLPIPSKSTITARGGTLHQTSGTGAPSLFHIAGITDIESSSLIHKLYYSGSTTDLAWKYNTPNSGYWAAAGNSHFDISGSYQIA